MGEDAFERLVLATPGSAGGSAEENVLIGAEDSCEADETAGFDNTSAGGSAAVAGDDGQRS